MRKKSTEDEQTLQELNSAIKKTSVHINACDILLTAILLNFCTKSPEFMTENPFASKLQDDRKKGNLD